MIKQTNANDVFNASVQAWKCSQSHPLCMQHVTQNVQQGPRSLTATWEAMPQA
jgi:DNA primase large subunit